MLEEFKKLTETLRRHIWCIILFALLLIFWLTAFFYTGRGNDIASWLSIILAILVIVYMFYQNARSEQNTSEMRGLINKGQQIIEEKAGVMTDEAKAIRETGLAIIAKYQPEVNVESAPLEGQSFQFDISNTRDVCLHILYSLVKSHESNKRTPFGEIAARIYQVEDPAVKSAGALAVLSLVCGLESFFEGISFFYDDSKGVPLGLEVKNLPTNFVGYVLDEVKKRIKERSTDKETKSTFEVVVEAIDDYFKS